MKYIIFAKIIILYVLVQFVNKRGKKAVILSALCLTFLISLFYLTIDLNIFFLTGEGSIWDSLFKISLLFFPALIYFWLLSQTQGLVYWVIMGLGMFYFLFLSNFPITT